ncbi:MAG: RecX family transcriptional regulator [Clostridiales bacterium]|nr:RecX family transcriptional regulator [Clostridiales bacterium]
MNNKFEIGKEVAIKYVMFKKRTEAEVTKKLEFLNYSPAIVEKIVNYLKEAGYINDERYAEKYFNEIKKLKNWSKVQIKNDLYKRGCKAEIDAEELNDYEIQSITNLYNKYIFKYPDHTQENLNEFITVLKKKGFEYGNIQKIIKTEE